MASAVEPEPQEEEEDCGDDDQCPEGVLEIDLSGMSAEQSEPILLAARQAGMRAQQPFKRAPGGGGGGGNRFQPRPKAKLQPQFQPRSARTPPRTGEREAKCGNFGGKHTTRDCPNPLLKSPSASVSIAEKKDTKRGSASSLIAANSHKVVEQC